MILKAVAGGGGRGMRICRSTEELPGLYQQASTEAANAFGNGDLYMEKFIERPRHIEFQVLADEHGNVMSLGERECSIQRRHQKLIEEAPQPDGHAQAARGAGQDHPASRSKDIGYWNAGTIEFLMDEDGKIYFIEMNTRIQVEHLRDRDGDRHRSGQGAVAHRRRREAELDIVTEPVTIRGHAIECRINAEHPEKFTPTAGKITAFNLPGGNGVRVDTAQYAEGVVPPYYDSLIAKLICHGKDREEAMNKMQRALSQFVVQGIHTTIPLHQKIFADRGVPLRQVRHQVHGAVLRAAEGHQGGVAVSPAEVISDSGRRILLAARATRSAPGRRAAARCRNRAAAVPRQDRLAADGAAKRCGHSRCLLPEPIAG